MPRRDSVLYEAADNLENLTMKTSIGVLTSYRSNKIKMSGFILSINMNSDQQQMTPISDCHKTAIYILQAGESKITIYDNVTPTPTETTEMQEHKY